MESDFKPGQRSAKSRKAAAKAKTHTDEETEVFRTPDEVAADQTPETPGEITLQDAPGPRKPDGGWKEKLALHWPPGRKEWITAAIIVVLIGGVGFALTRPSPKPVATQIKKAAPKVVKPKTVPSTLSGLPVDPAVNARPATGVMIENSLDSRPQAGLSQASVVFEAIAEGGITRFLALYQDTAPDNIGPVRSARPYYIEWNMAFNAGYAHVGGSPQALADIKAWGIRDLDQFANGGSYHRVADRAAPHNVYTSMAALNQLEASKGWTSSAFTGFVRKPKEAPVKTPLAKTIDLKLSGPLYNVHYDYVPAANSYARSEGGAPHTDANTNAQIGVKVVVAMVVPYGIAPDGHHSEYATIGSGPVSIFQDGTVTTGTWTKTAGPNQITFADAAGKPIALNPGQTWLTTVGAAGNITYAP
jgi:hypothetical protein